MDSFYIAIGHFRKRNFTECARICTEILQANPQHQSAWLLKLRALTQRVAYDDTDVLESLAEASTSCDSHWTKTAPPGTSTISGNNTQRKATSNRPPTRPVSGVVRLNKSGLSHDGLSTASRAQTGRLLSRLGTASLSVDDETFINVARLNLPHYASSPQLAKPLFEYLYFVQADVKNALELANQAQQSSSQRDGKNYYWKCAIVRCLVRLGLVRQIIQTGTLDWHVQMNNSDGLLLMAKSYLIIDQPLAALEVYRKGLEKFPKDTVILTGIARIHEELRQPEDSVSSYKQVLNYDSSNTEAVACVAAHFFYTGQPEWALLLYKRLLQMGIHTAEVLCNIALCCLKTQQYDMIVPFIENALALAKDDLLADVWYNAGHVSLATGNLEMAELCWKLARRINPNHSEACNNLGVLALRNGRIQEGKALLNAALSLEEDLPEAKKNLDQLMYQDNEVIECLI